MVSELSMGAEQYSGSVFARIDDGGDILTPPAEAAALAFVALKAGDEVNARIWVDLFWRLCTAGPEARSVT